MSITEKLLLPVALAVGIPAVGIIVVGLWWMLLNMLGVA